MIENDPLTEKIIGAAIEVHRVLGPGLLESAYEECLCHELQMGGIAFVRQQPLPVTYKGVHLDCGAPIGPRRRMLGDRRAENRRPPAANPRGSTPNVSALDGHSYRVDSELQCPHATPGNQAPGFVKYQ